MSKMHVAHTKPLSRMQSLSESHGAGWSKLTRPIFSNSAKHYNHGHVPFNQIPTGPTGKSGPPQKVDPFFQNFSDWTKPIH